MRRSLPTRVFRAVRRRLRRIFPGAVGPQPPPLPPGQAPAGMPPIFIGGTGRSGTTVMGRLLGSHPDWAELPSETKFITGPGGLCELLEGKVTFDQFETWLRGEAYRNGLGRGLHMMADLEAVDALLPRLRSGLESEPWAAAAAFVHDLLDPVAIDAGKKGWVDTTPSNAYHAVALLRMFPNMRLVHMVRDGRDVALSVTRRRWGPDDIDEALVWWARRLERAFASCERLPADRVLTIQMEDLFIRDRHRSFRKLLAFTGVTPDPAVVAYFENETTARKAHAGRWRNAVPEERVAAFEAHHARRARAMRARGRPYRPYVPAQGPTALATG